MRKCNKCSQEKTLEEFPKNKGKHLGRGHYCRECSNKVIRDNSLTKNGVITAIWNGQRHSSRYRGMDMPTYTKQELSEWLINQKLFHELYDKWVESGYFKGNKPSVDRINDYVGYTMDNIQLMTFKQNLDKSHQDKINGKNTKQCRAVVGTIKGTEESTVFYSVAEASRVTGANGKNIQYCCQGKPKYKSAGGYTWKYL